jgi:hypothetical protein
MVYNQQQRQMHNGLDVEGRRSKVEGQRSKVKGRRSIINSNVKCILDGMLIRIYWITNKVCDFINNIFRSAVVTAPWRRFSTGLGQ